MLREAGIEMAEIAGIDEAAMTEMTRARDLARAAPPPTPESAYEDVQDIGAPRAFS
jgi:TPP-dependent pyruvate/acetoin dehydrogenase alpha subunit